MRTYKHKILNINSKKQLSNLLGKPYSHLLQMARNPQYYQFFIPKKSGGVRTIQAPNEEHKRLQSEINRILQDVYSDMDLGCVYGFNQSQSEHIKANARHHIQKRQVFNTDIKNFFPNISSASVRDMFMSVPFYFNESLATLMAMLTTYDNALPTGAPSSPIISNFIFYNTDKRLNAFAKNNDLSYSRYADDLTFSSNSDITVDLITEIYKIIEADNFVINTKKSRLQQYYNRQTVTGITVNEKVNVNRKYIRQIRAILHDINNRGLELASQRFFDLDSSTEEKQTELINILRGRIEFVGFVRGKEDAVYLGLKNKINLS
jgi:RNA-directed DNA polymerase